MRLCAPLYSTVQPLQPGGRPRPGVLLSCHASSPALTSSSGVVCVCVRVCVCVSHPHLPPFPPSLRGHSLRLHHAQGGCGRCWCSSATASKTWRAPPTPAAPRASSRARPTWSPSPTPSPPNTPSCAAPRERYATWYLLSRPLSRPLSRSLSNPQSYPLYNPLSNSSSQVPRSGEVPI